MMLKNQKRNRRMSDERKQQDVIAAIFTVSQIILFLIRISGFAPIPWLAVFAPLLTVILFHFVMLIAVIIYDYLKSLRRK